VGPQLNGFVFFNTSKKGSPHSIDLEMNLFRAASLPASLCASFLEVEGSMLRIASIFLGWPRFLSLRRGTKQLSLAYTKYAFLRVQFESRATKVAESPVEVFDMILFELALYNDVIHIG
jgi:hypothetical protein